MIENGRSTLSSTVRHVTFQSVTICNLLIQSLSIEVRMSITTTGNLGPMILQSLAPAMLYVPTPTMNYITVCDKVSMPPNGGTTCRFMRPSALIPRATGASELVKTRMLYAEPNSAGNAEAFVG